MAAEVGKPKREVTALQPSTRPWRSSVAQRAAGAAERDPRPAATTKPSSQRRRRRAGKPACYRAGRRGRSAWPRQVEAAFEEAYKETVRDAHPGTTVSARTAAGLTEIRPIWCEVDVSPRAHGSGLFTRGETQVLTLATLGTPSEAQELDTLTPTDSKRYMHHYNFPPFSTGEVKPLRGSVPPRDRARRPGRARPAPGHPAG